MERLRYVKGYCELEDGVVRFEGGVQSVSDLQAWYYIIYGLRDRYPKIDYWIDPELEKCEVLDRNETKLRNTVCKILRCVFEPYPNGEIRPRRKLSKEERDKFSEGVTSILPGRIPVLEFKNEEVTQPREKTKRMTFDLANGMDLNEANRRANKSLVSKGNEGAKKTVESYCINLREILTMSLEVFNGKITLDKYQKESSELLTKMETLVQVMTNTVDEVYRRNQTPTFNKIRVCANKIAGWSMKTKDEEVDKILTSTAMRLLEMSNTLNKREDA